MADLNSTIVRGNLRVTDDINTSGYIYENGTTLINSSILTIKGDIIYASAANTPARLAIGSDGQFLSIASGIPTWVNNPNSDTKNTAGSTNSTSKLFLIGANTQAANPQTYSNQYLFYENNELNIGGVKISTDSIASSGTQLALGVTDTNDSGDRVTAVYICTDYDDNNNFIGTSVIARGRFVAYGDDDGSNPNKPIDQTNSDDLDTDYFNTGITLRGDETYKLSFPAKSGIIGTQIDIVDLTSLS